MKIQCDVCNKDAATLFCVADEAALCDGCDRRVHHANKLAGKHHRFSLLQPTEKEVPLCDICQERKAFLFCQQDRAILCRECDNSIHKANEHTKKHSRFLLTGVKFSAESTLYSSSSSPSSSLSNVSDGVPTFDVQSSIKKPVAPEKTATIATKTACDHKDVADTQLISGSTSSISEYLIDLLPGWHVEDLLDPSTQNAFFKSSQDDLQQFWDADLGHNQCTFSGAESTSLWVPQIPPQSQAAIPTPIQAYPYSGMSLGTQISFKDTKNVTTIKPSRKLSYDNSFAVPQIPPPSNSTAFKRSRTMW